MPKCRNPLCSYVAYFSHPSQDNPAVIDHTYDGYCCTKCYGRHWTLDWAKGGKSGHYKCCRKLTYNEKDEHLYPKEGQESSPLPSSAAPISAKAKAISAVPAKPKADLCLRPPGMPPLMPAGESNLPKASEKDRILAAKTRLEKSAANLKERLAATEDAIQKANQELRTAPTPALQHAEVLRKVPKNDSASSSSTTPSAEAKLVSGLCSSQAQEDGSIKHTKVVASTASKPASSQSILKPATDTTPLQHGRFGTYVIVVRVPWRSSTTSIISLPGMERLIGEPLNTWWLKNYKDGTLFAIELAAHQDASKATHWLNSAAKARVSGEIVGDSTKKDENSLYAFVILTPHDSDYFREKVSLIAALRSVSGASV